MFGARSCGNATVVGNLFGFSYIINSEYKSKAMPPKKALRGMPRKNFKYWQDKNPDKVTITNGKIDYINSPNWHGGFTKGGNIYSFANMEFKDMCIHNAFGEGLGLAGSVFENVIFDGGDFSRACFADCRFIDTKFNKTIFTDASFNGASFINCNLNRVNLSNAQFCLKEIIETVVYGIAAWDLHTCDGMIQSKLIIEKTYQLYSDFEREGKIPVMVEDIELAQFVHYLSDHKKLRNTINIFNDKGVLLLGQFKNGGKERLYKIYDWLKSKDYMPMIFDFARPEQLNYTETIVTMAGLAKFIIADLSGRSVPQELFAISSNFKKPIIAFSKRKEYSMFKDIKSKNDSVIDFIVNTDHELIEKIDKHLPLVEEMTKRTILMLSQTHK